MPLDGLVDFLTFYYLIRARFQIFLLLIDMDAVFQLNKMTKELLLKEDS
jgi:hypothetical protein